LDGIAAREPRKVRKKGKGWDIADKKLQGNAQTDLAWRENPISLG